MAIGIPGMRVGGAPFFITGEFKREYQFQFVLFPSAPTSLSIKKLPKWVLSLFSSLHLTYISSLAEQVNLPPLKFVIGNTTLGTLQGYPYPKGFETPTFSVVYLEDELDSVYKFHMVWQNNIRTRDGDFDMGGLQFEPLGNVCCMAIYSPTKPVSISHLGDIPSGISIGDSSMSIPLGVDVPLGADIWPFVFPSEIQRSPANKGGSGIAKTTVVYTRVPDIRNWNYFSSVKKVVASVEIGNPDPNAEIEAREAVYRLNEANAKARAAEAARAAQEAAEAAANAAGG